MPFDLSSKKSAFVSGSGLKSFFPAFEVSGGLLPDLLCSVLLAFRMATQTQGIQQLLAAEKKAADKVADARKRKARRLKQAKEEAQAEIEKYREQREREFKEYENHHLGSRDDIASKIDIETVKRINAMNQRVDQNKEQVIKSLLDMVYNVEPRLHKNYQG